jgi:ferric-dicitrate binding protein FerR (iron transport regulator)
LSTYPEHIDNLIGLVLSGEATPEQLAELRAWRNSNPDQEAYFLEMDKLMTLPEPEVLSDVDVDAAWNKVSSQIVQPKNDAVLRRLNPGVWRIAAAAILLMVAGVYWYQGVPKNEFQLLSETAITKGTLPDGSEVVLNSGSKIHYREQRGVRRVSLLGEAYFKISHDEVHPFTVEVLDLTVTDIGTAFNIRSVSDSDLVEVTVEEGEVNLKGPDLSINLKAGEGLIYKKGKTQGKFQLHHRNASAYATGRLEFINVPLSEVAEVLGKKFAVSVRVNDAVSNCTLTADFSNEELDTILEILATTMQLEVIRSGNSIELKGSGCI